MKIFRAFLWVLVLQLMVVAACTSGGKSEAALKTEMVDSVTVDSDAIVLSLTPTVECLPLYYAQHAGIFKTLGLKVSLKTCSSQFDCDTTILGGTAIGGSSDLVRLHYYANEGKQLSAVTALDGQWYLLSSAGLRIKKTQLLANRMIAVARFSASDYFSKVALDESDLDYSDVFRPQINDYYLRSSMLKNNQIDAAILPEPFATQAKLAGHRVLYHNDAKSVRMGCLVFRPEVLANDTVEMVKLLLKGYNKAVAELNSKGKVACKDILIHDLKMSAVVYDSLSWPKFNKAGKPSADDIQKAQDFLNISGKWGLKKSPEYLFNETLLPKQ